MQIKILNKKSGRLLLDKIKTQESLTEIIRLIQYSGDYKNVAYFMSPNAPTSNKMPFFHSTYQKRWIERYLRMEYGNIDPILYYGLDKDIKNKERHYFWDDIEGLNDQQKDFFKDSVSYEIGKRGVTFPISILQNATATFSLTSDLELDDWRHKITAEKEILGEIAHELHVKAILEVYSSEEMPSLSRREVECLNLIAKGKESPVIAIELGISEHTVRDYLKSVRKKLGCKTLAQAVFKATKMRIIGI
ncbi:MAG: hypothetical protein COC17_00385 [Hyphomicrobiales bacterium]|nr:LuxR family transcriptional regulator [Hyphomicrobiales bacterium]PCH51586.1 MAG: hypothetical protein COC17_00385 [Hyphomicrobiales bacterium]